MATFKPIALSHQEKKDGTFPVKIRVTNNRSVAYLSTPWYVTKKELKGKGSTLDLRDGMVLDKLNLEIMSLREDCLEIADIEYMSAKDVITALKGIKERRKPWSINFIDYIKQDRQQLINNNKEGTASLRRSMLNSLTAFLGSDNLPIERITRSLLQQWIDWIPKQPHHKERKGKVQALYITQIKAVYNKAKREFNDEDMNIIRVPWNPFKCLELPKQEPVVKRAITLEQLQKIIAMQGKFSGRKGLAVDMFLLSFFLIGMNAADFYTCTNYDGKRITYNRKKTASRRLDNAEYSVLVPDEVRPILEKYLGGNGRVFRFHKMYSSIAVFENAISRGLDYLDDEVGVKDLQFYAARHTWATLASNEVGIDKYVVHTALNHVDEKMAVTDLYIKKSWKPIDEANRKVIDHVMSKKNP